MHHEFVEEEKYTTRFNGRLIVRILRLASPHRRWMLTFIPVLVVLSVVFKRHILDEFRNVRRLNSRITGSYGENISGVKVVKSLRREKPNLAEFGSLTGDMYRAGFRAAWLSALFLPAVQLVSACGVGLIVLVGGY